MALHKHAPLLIALLFTSMHGLSAYAQAPGASAAATPAPATAAPTAAAPVEATAASTAAPAKSEEEDATMAPVEIQDLPPAKPLNADEQEVADEKQKEANEAIEGPQNFPDYNRPLLFSPEDNKIEITSPQVRWDLTDDKINLGGLKLEANSMRVILDQLNRDDLSGRYRESGRTEQKTTNVSFV